MFGMNLGNTIFWKTVSRCFSRKEKFITVLGIDVLFFVLSILVLFGFNKLFSLLGYDIEGYVFLQGESMLSLVMARMSFFVVFVLLFSFFKRYSMTIVASSFPGYDLIHKGSFWRFLLLNSVILAVMVIIFIVLSFFVNIFVVWLIRNEFVIVVSRMAYFVVLGFVLITSNMFFNLSTIIFLEENSVVEPIFFCLRFIGKHISQALVYIFGVSLYVVLWLLALSLLNMLLNLNLIIYLLAFIVIILVLMTFLKFYMYNNIISRSRFL